MVGREKRGVGEEDPRTEAGVCVLSEDLAEAGVA